MKRGPGARLGFRPGPAAVKLRDLLHREKPDPAAAFGVRVRIPDTEELFEETARFFGREALAFVPDGQGAGPPSICSRSGSNSTVRIDMKMGAVRAVII
jgi:hypothetical protein